MAEGLELLEQVDHFAPARNALRTLGERAGEWAGIPIPLDEQRLVVDPSYPFAQVFKRSPEEEEEEKAKLRGSFWSSKLRSDVCIWEVDGKIEWGIVPGFNHLAQAIMTLGASVVWGIEQEANALQKLGTLLRHHTFKHYLMTGMFLETSPRSGITYIFRKLRPTVAVKEGRGRRGGETRMRILCALCLHPIAYYEGSWAGAMCPTDDVIAHLMLMRGDEPMFWRRANQHPPHRPEAGI